MFPRLSSITARLIILLTLGTTILWCAAAAYSSYVISHELNEAYDRALQQAAHRLLPLAADDVLGHEEDDHHAVERFTAGAEKYLSYQLRDHKGRILLRTHDAPTAPYDAEPTAGLSTNGGYRLFTHTDAETGLTITVAESTEERWHTVFDSAKAMLWPLLGLIPLNILVIWLTVRAAMRPVQRLSQSIAERGGQNLAPLDISDQPIELRPIAQAVARFVERLRLALDAERHFAANSAHELRTPIAGALAQTQRLIAELKDSKTRNRASEIETTLKRLSALSEKLLQISRVDAGVGFSGEEVDLLPVLDLVVDDYTKRSDASSRLIYKKAAGVQLVARMDMDAFAIAIRNLIDNALRHGDSHQKVEVVVEGAQMISVINDCPVIDPELLTRLKERFARGRNRNDGAGLGLAIVDTIMNQTMGKLELFSPAIGRSQGFEARLILHSTKLSS